MLLAVDIGNSHTVIGLYKNNTLIGQWRIQSNPHNTSDELAITCGSLFNTLQISVMEITGIVIASVVPTLQTAWVRFCKKFFPEALRQKTVILSFDNLKGLIEVVVDNPREVGVDRLVNAIAAVEQQECNQVVIDFGTAITFDCVSGQRQYLGGSIVPGISISLDALASRTAKLPRVDITEGPPPIIGKNTVQAIKSGVLHGYGAMIDGLVQSIKSEMSGDSNRAFAVTATGGIAHLIAPYTRSIDRLDPLLTLRGLHLIYRRLINDEQA